MSPTLETRDLTIRFGGHIAVDGVSSAFRPGELTAIVGPNGAGKTTYFNLMSGQLRPTAGEIFVRGADVTKLARRSAPGSGSAALFNSPIYSPTSPSPKTCASPPRPRQASITT